MRNKATILLGIGLLIVSLAASADGGKRTHIEGSDNWGYLGGPEMSSRVICPRDELSDNPFPCPDLLTGRIHVRDGAGWSCYTSDDPRTTGLGLWVTAVNFDADGNAEAWGEWYVVPMVGCNKDVAYSGEYENLVRNAASFWHGTWSGERQFDSDQNAWVLTVAMQGKGFGNGLDGLQYKATEWITTFTPLPAPYEAIFPPGTVEYDMPEGYFSGVITENKNRKNDDD